MLLGMSKCATNRTSGLSMPMPNAIVATMTRPSSRRKRAWFEARVIRQRRYVVLIQVHRHLVDRVARQAIDDAGVAIVFAADEVDQLFARIVFLHHPIADVGPIETGDEHTRVHEQAFDDLAPGRHVGGRRQRDAWHALKALAQK